ncbi:MAG: SRPBCC family protein [Ferruginibacter sp.]|nr:SRPBCC family protein [Ferruginibacter sp.]
MKDYFNKTFPTALEQVKKLAEARKAITIEAAINAPVDKVWQYWSAPEHIKQWCSASSDWHVPHATNDLKAGGNFSTRMEAKDGSFGFDFGGIYDDVKTNELIAYTMADGRKVTVSFTSDGNATKVVETFDPENQNPVEMQRAGWQAILENFKKHVEEN